MVVLSLDNGISCLLTVIFWLLYMSNTPESSKLWRVATHVLIGIERPDVADFFLSILDCHESPHALLFISRGRVEVFVLRFCQDLVLHSISSALLCSILCSTRDSLRPLLVWSLDSRIASSSTTGLQNNNLPSSAGEQVSKHSSVLFYMSDKWIPMKWTCISHDNLH